MIHVRLDQYALGLAVEAAFQATEAVKAKGMRARYGQDERRSPSDRLFGKQGEAAVAMTFGCLEEWAATAGEVGPDRERGDVAGYQVRTNHREWGHLFVQPNDPEDQDVILVTGHDPPWFRLVGWLPIAQAKNRLHRWRAPRGNTCYRVPQAVLRDMADIPVLALTPR